MMSITYNYCVALTVTLFFFVGIALRFTSEYFPYAIGTFKSNQVNRKSTKFAFNPTNLKFIYCPIHTHMINAHTPHSVLFILLIFHALFAKINNFWHSNHDDCFWQKSINIYYLFRSMWNLLGLWHWSLQRYLACIYIF